MIILDMYKYIHKDSFNSNKIHHSTIVPSQKRTSICPTFP